MLHKRVALLAGGLVASLSLAGLIAAQNQLAGCGGSPSLAAARLLATQPEPDPMNEMQGKQDMGGMMRMMEQCREHCQAASTSMDELTQALEEAEQSNDPARMRAALGQARQKVTAMKQHMSACMSMMDEMHDDMMGDTGMMCPMCGRMQEGAAGRSELNALPEPAAEGVSSLLDAYFRIGDRLAEDSTQDIAQDARAVAEETDRLTRIEIPDNPWFWERHTETRTIRESCRSLASAEEVAEARRHYAELSGALAKLVHATGVPPSVETKVEAMDCPMYPEGEGGAIWLQASGKVRNPYMGSAMSTCVGTRQALPVTGAPGRGGGR